MKPSPIARRARQLGVSLIEATTAMAVVSTAVALAAPSYKSAIERRHLEGTAQQFETDVHWARSLAVTRNRSLQMSFSVAADHTCYVIHDGNPNACQCAGADSAVCTGAAQALRTVQVKTQTGVRVESNSASIGFDPAYGTTTPTGTVQFIGSGGAKIHQIVNIMGRVRSCTPEGSVAGYRPC
jgi:type IV fimbrial biogenesis protein FimT